jgi:hypothetical protein
MLSCTYPFAECFQDRPLVNSLLMDAGSPVEIKLTHHRKCSNVGFGPVALQPAQRVGGQIVWNGYF